MELEKMWELKNEILNKAVETQSGLVTKIEYSDEAMEAVEEIAELEGWEFWHDCNNGNYIAITLEAY